MSDNIRSLNLSNTAALLIYESFETTRSISNFTLIDKVNAKINQEMLY